MALVSNAQSINQSVGTRAIGDLPLLHALGIISIVIEHLCFRHNSRKDVRIANS